MFYVAPCAGDRPVADRVGADPGVDLLAGMKGEVGHHGKDQVYQAGILG